jgi:plastocyanin
VIATEYHLTLSRSEVRAGKVIVNFVNDGQDEHNLHTLEPTAGTEAPSVPNTKPGAHPELTMILSPGSYTMFCSLPEHEAKGMKATLLVK